MGLGADFAVGAGDLHHGKLGKMDQSNKRYIIVSTGRTGSSLLSAIMMNAGANFGMPLRESWNPESGAYEHPLFWSAYAWYSRMNKINSSIIPNAFGYKYCKKQMDNRLHKLLGQADYVKYPTGAIWLVHAIARLGYQTRVIISYRSFESYASSRYLKFGWSITRMMENYINVYGTALLQLKLLGGCAINFDEIVNHNETMWADALENVTGLSRESLLNARDHLVKDKERTPEDWSLLNSSVIDEQVHRVYAAMQSLKGQALIASK